MVVLASAGGNTVPAIARLVQADEDTIRQVIHRFNEMRMASLDPRWAGVERIAVIHVAAGTPAGQVARGQGDAPAAHGSSRSLCWSTE
jgi:Winged helix-turn helix